MTLEELTPWLFARTSGGIRWGLDRTRALLAGVGDPHRRFHALHVGGTNGKGSVAALCDAALRGAGDGRRRVGLYTSPHLVSFTERVRVDGRPVPESVLLRAAERLRPAIEESDASFFEATTAVAFLCFAELEVEIAVVEVGLGGRLDATNVLQPAAVAITNVTREHTDYLGETLAEIAREKAGIFKPGVPALTAQTHPGVLAVLHAAAAAVEAPLRSVDELSALESVETGPSGTTARLRSDRWGERTLRVPLAGEHQARNAVLAAELLGLLPDALRPGWAEVEAGFASARWPGRMQVERIGTTTWLFDVAHNPAGIATLVRALERMDLPRPLVLVAGILSDKEWEAMLPPLLDRVDGAVLTIPPSAPESRRWDPAEAARRLAGDARRAPRAIPDFAAAIARAATLAPHGTVIVSGSFHTVGDAMAHLGVPAV